MSLTRFLLYFLVLYQYICFVGNAEIQYFFIVIVLVVVIVIAIVVRTIIRVVLQLTAMWYVESNYKFEFNH